MSPALEFRDVTKNYRARDLVAAGAPWRERLRNLFHTRRSFTALDQISFGCEHGEALGIIGHNGAGKSTVLKLVSRITAPTKGEIRIVGSLSALIEVSSGFHPELTGRENVYLNGAMFGMSRKEIAAKLDSIVTFSEIGSFLDIPVKRYSSGMYLRLGFAIAAHLEPDILLLDEVLAVGDFAFQRKCLARVDELKHAKKTIVFISHDLAAVERLCDRVLLLDHGRILKHGKPREVILEYQQSALMASTPPPFAGDLSLRVKCIGFSHRPAPANATSKLRTGDAMTVTVDYFAEQMVAGAMVNVYIYWPSGYLCTHLSTGTDGLQLEAGPGHIEFHCPELNLPPGLFLIDIAIERPPEIMDWRQRCGYLRIDPGGKPVWGDVYTPHFWRHLPAEPGEWRPGANQIGHFAGS